jgi:Protein of unknown function (DUF2783)
MTTKLETTSRFADPDAAYRAIIEAHRGLDDAQSAALNAALVLVLANHIGDHGVLDEVLKLAKSSVSFSATSR